MEREMERVWHKNYDSGIPHSLRYPDKCLPLLIEENASEFPQNTVTELFGAKLTYRALWEHVKSFAATLSQLGVKKGTGVAIMLPNCPQAIIAYYATLWLGGIVIFTNPMYVEREMEHQWKDSDAEFLILLDHLYPRVEKVLDRTGIRKIIVTSLREYLPWYLKVLYPFKARKDKLFTAAPYSEHILNFSQLISKGPPPAPHFSASLDDLALLQYTGGTTGTAKGVMLSHRNILANVVQISTWFTGLRRGQERMLAVLPFFHVFGMTVTMNLSLYIGASIIILPRFEINQLFKTIAKSRPTVFPGVPTIYVAIVNHPNVQSFDLSSIRICVTGSAPMPLEVLRKFESLTGGVIVEGFGLTESSPVTHANPLKGLRKPGSIGIALPDTDFRIVDLLTGTEEMPVGQEGELLVRGPQVTSGYWKMPAETASALRDGWLFTGDIAKMDEDGYVFIVDRKKDMIIAGGFNVYPREVDEVLYEHPKILDAVAVGIPDPYRGETIKAFVVPKKGEALTEEEVIQYCKSRLAAYKVPKQIEFRDALPKTIVGKILRKELRAEEVSKQKPS